ncbi:DUF3099 domain-containing protein [Leucobacter sp. cx-328]|uniref:DUF3099 domain-containing protein n=1 Tax=unclassified Leucobacter TaxID=2621730 RepID=UPI00165DCD4C|nr:MULTISPECIES: DUF3099 domain-containing protein [unclassified Leucobacter]MBC9943916.1 DUF3099 domain-containing protein [Leucobacter sp. cx-328]
MSKTYRVTSAGVNPAADRAHREKMYYISMGLRVPCVLSLFWVQGWWVLLSAAGAIILPWFAVMIGNAVAHGGGEEVDAPEPLQLEPLVAEEELAGESHPQAQPVIVVDVDPQRRSGSRDSEGDDA